MAALPCPGRRPAIPPPALRSAPPVSYVTPLPAAACAWRPGGSHVKRSTCGRWRGSPRCPRDGGEEGVVPPEDLPPLQTSRAMPVPSKASLQSATAASGRTRSGSPLVRSRARRRPRSMAHAVRTISSALPPRPVPAQPLESGALLDPLPGLSPVRERASSRATSAPAGTARQRRVRTSRSGRRAPVSRASLASRSAASPKARTSSTPADSGPVGTWISWSSGASGAWASAAFRPTLRPAAAASAARPGPRRGPSRWGDHDQGV